jgi:hypothetical protein
VRTAERRLHRAGYAWGKAPQGQYFNGHEREDVVSYRQTNYIDAWKKLESRMAVYTSDGMKMDLERTVPLQPGEKQVVAWFHDESTFYAHDRQLIHWVYVGEHPDISPKGEGNSVMIQRRPIGRLTKFAQAREEMRNRAYLGRRALTPVVFESRLV